MQNGIELGKVVDQLRTELHELTKSVKGQELYFLVDNVEVELQVAVTKGGEGGVTAKFWVLEVGGKGTYESTTTQTVKLTLKPVVNEGGTERAAKVRRRKKA